VPPSGSEPIIFQGGSWDGDYTDIVKKDPPLPKVERRTIDGMPGEIDIYVRSQDTVQFQPLRLKKPKQSTVYKFAGTVRR